MARARRLALLCIALMLSSCSKDGDTITYENPTATAPSSGTIVAVTETSILVNVSATAPGTVLSAVPIQGLPAGESFVGIDYRPLDKQLYGWGTDDRLYRINAVTGVALQVGTTLNPVAGTYFGFDFSPVADRARVVSESDTNVRVNPADGTIAPDGALAFSVGDINAGVDPFISGIAYTNNIAGAATTTLYGIEQSGNVLVTVNPPNNGTLNTVGSLNTVVTLIGSGFDISPGGVAYAALGGPNVLVSLYTINLTTGAATSVGTLGTGAYIVGMAIVP